MWRNFTAKSHKFSRCSVVFVLFFPCEIQKNYSFSFSHGEICFFNLYKHCMCKQQRLWRDKAFVQAGLSLSWLHMWWVTKSHFVILLPVSISHRFRQAKVLNVKLWIFSNSSSQTCVVGAQMRLSETVLLSIHNICFGWEIRKLIFNHVLLSRGVLTITECVTGSMISSWPASILIVNNWSIVASTAPSLARNTASITSSSIVGNISRKSDIACDEKHGRQWSS